MTNQEFCYWLQGYFEISQARHLTREKVLVIRDCLLQIKDPLGTYTQWLMDVIDFFAKQNYKESLIDYFTQEIQNRLNLIFYHVIDNNYDENIGREFALQIHNGETT